MTKWGTHGCRCRQCARRVPMLEFAIPDDVVNQQLECGARRALVGLFGEGWVHQKFASLPLRICETILKGLSKRTTPLNHFPLLFAAERKLGIVIELLVSVDGDAYVASLYQVYISLIKSFLSFLIYFLYRLWCLLVCFVRILRMSTPYCYRYFACPCSS